MPHLFSLWSPNSCQNPNFRHCYRNKKALIFRAPVGAKGLEPLTPSV
jgi:hypothetical protein